MLASGGARAIARSMASPFCPINFDMRSLELNTTDCMRESASAAWSQL